MAKTDLAGHMALSHKLSNSIGMPDPLATISSFMGVVA